MNELSQPTASRLRRAAIGIPDYYKTLADKGCVANNPRGPADSVDRSHMAGMIWVDGDTNLFT